MTKRRPTIRLYTTNKSLAKEVTDWFRGEPIRLEVISEAEKFPARGTATGQFLLTRNALGRDIEWAAARIGAMVAVLPEASDYVIKKCLAGGVSDMFGNDLATAGHL